MLSIKIEMHFNVAIDYKNRVFIRIPIKTIFMLADNVVNQTLIASSFYRREEIGNNALKTLPSKKVQHQPKRAAQVSFTRTRHVGRFSNDALRPPSHACAGLKPVKTYQ